MYCTIMLNRLTPTNPQKTLSHTHIIYRSWRAGTLFTRFWASLDSGHMAHVYGGVMFLAGWPHQFLPPVKTSRVTSSSGNVSCYQSLFLFLAVSVWIHMISSGILAGVVLLPAAHISLQTMPAGGSSPHRWWCKVSLHLVGVTHDSAWLLSGRVGVRLFHKRGKASTKETAVCSEEMDLCWWGCVSACKDVWQMSCAHASLATRTHPFTPKVLSNHTLAPNSGATAQI